MRGAEKMLKCNHMRILLPAVILLFSGLLPMAHAEMHRVILDGLMDDWTGLDPVHSDPLGDGGSSGIDIGGIWIAEDEERLFIRFEVGTDLLLNEDNNLTLYLDTDSNPATGYPLGILGAELVWHFGTRDGFFFHSGGWENILWPDIDLIAGPTHSGPDVELSLSRSAVPLGTEPLFPTGEFKMLMHDESGGDWAPDIGGLITYTFDQGTLEPLETIYLDPTPSAVRLVTYNAYQDELFYYSAQDSWERILQAIDPDIIAFQEIYDHTATQTRNLIQGWLGGTWNAYQISDKILLTRGGILDTWSIYGGRAGAYLLAPLGDFEHDLLVINVHLSCCGADEERQAQCDAIMEFIRDAKTAGGLLDLGPENPIIITGDTNFVGSSRQLVTLLTGDILDNTTYGPDFAPDWDDTDLTDLVSRHVTEPMGYTWYKPWSTYWPGRLDFIIYTDSNLDIPLSAILQTNFLPTAYRNLYGLASGDTDDASDHLPHFADLSGVSQSVAELPPEGIPGLRLHLAGGNPTRRVEIGFSLDAAITGPARVSIHDATGRQVRLLTADVILRDGLRLAWNGRDDGDRTCAPGTYWVRVATARGETAGRIVLLD